MTDTYFAPLTLLPSVINEFGDYLTRSGEIVTIMSLSSSSDFKNLGVHETGVLAAWHRSGRILTSSETSNDIVRPI